MTEENATKPEEKPSGDPQFGLIGTFLNKLGLRSLFHGLGGRKTVLGGGAIGVITMIVQSDMADWPKAIACGAVAIVATAVTIAIAIEDRKKA